jgi:hypothetical protein
VNRPPLWVADVTDPQPLQVQKQATKDPKLNKQDLKLVKSQKPGKALAVGTILLYLLAGVTSGLMSPHQVAPVSMPGATVTGPSSKALGKRAQKRKAFSDLKSSAGPKSTSAKPEKTLKVEQQPAIGRPLHLSTAPRSRPP